MSLDVVFPKAHTCVWMEAGVISFWLCSREFDCEHCPLDTALRGGSPVPDQLVNNPTTDRVRRPR